LTSGSRTDDYLVRLLANSYWSCIESLSVVPLLSVDW